MKMKDLETPAIIVRSKALEKNLQKYHEECLRRGKRLWPMIKTHKSTKICKMLENLGSDGCLCGTLDECEALCQEVRKIRVTNATDLKVGDRIMIIPNHACSAANLTDYYVLIDEENSVEGLIRVDIRGNRTDKGIYIVG